MNCQLCLRTKLVLIFYARHSQLAKKLQDFLLLLSRFLQSYHSQLSEKNTFSFDFESTVDYKFNSWPLVRGNYQNWGPRPLYYSPGTTETCHGKFWLQLSRKQGNFQGSFSVTMVMQIQQYQKFIPASEKRKQNCSPFGTLCKVIYDNF